MFGLIRTGYGQVLGYRYGELAYHLECFPYQQIADGEQITALYDTDEDASELVCDGCWQPLVEEDELEYDDLVGYIYDDAAYHPECLPEDVDPDSDELEAVSATDEDASELVCDSCLQPLLDDDNEDFAED